MPLEAWVGAASRNKAAEGARVRYKKDPRPATACRCSCGMALLLIQDRPGKPLSCGCGTSLATARESPSSCMCRICGLSSSQQLSWRLGLGGLLVDSLRGSAQAVC